ncbi:hypothetical protein [uncultured Treponema sp.]|uniref:hypothetical protein n=1 Tax=uncultured Treponema sp. TaxID=162155 RepID=UPI0025DE777F|nr:hypothetical protein [uncultured Treponema sp.]
MTDFEYQIECTTRDLADKLIVDFSIFRTICTYCPVWLYSRPNLIVPTPQSSCISVPV